MSEHFRNIGEITDDEDFDLESKESKLESIKAGLKRKYDDIMTDDESDYDKNAEINVPTHNLVKTDPIAEEINTPKFQTSQIRITRSSQLKLVRS